MILSIDPGIDGTGIAVWNEDPDWRTSLSSVKVWSRPSVEGWVSKCIELSDLYYNLHESVQPVRIYCEWPAYHQTGVGQAATAKGDIHKLSFLIGMFAREVADVGGEFILVPVAEWKGQLPKQVVQRRIEKAYAGTGVLEGLKLKKLDHSWDAIGIGMYAKGFRFDGSTENNS